MYGSDGDEELQHVSRAQGWPFVFARLKNFIAASKSAIMYRACNADVWTAALSTLGSAF